MGFLSKKSMLVSLLALPLAACTPTPNPKTTIQEANTVTLQCDGDAGENDVAITITFQLAANSTCDLVDVYFIKDKHGNSQHLTKQPRASGDPHVVFGYGGTTSKPAGDGAFFYYITKSHTSPSPDGGGGGIIK